MKRKVYIVLIIILLCLNTSLVFADESGIPRIAGNDRYSTARLISENFSSVDTDNVILTTGNNYADALGASVLAYQKKAPILLVAESLSASTEAIAYITDYLKENGTVYIIGGTAVIGKDYETYLTSKGFTVKRLGGVSRYDTDILIAEELGVTSGTPLIIASGENYPDALSMSSPAAANGWPVLLVQANNIPQVIIDYIVKINPIKIYIGGGTAVISSVVENRIKELVPDAEITRIAGQDRYETSIKIAKYFYPNSNLQFIASGINFPDALAGSVLAAVNQSPILLIDNNQSALPTALSNYLNGNVKKGKMGFMILGGRAVITDTQYTLLTQSLN